MSGEEYITRSSSLQAVGDIHPLDYNGQGIVERIKAIPAADVLAVRHGKWQNPEDAECYQCSVCGKYRNQAYGLIVPIFDKFCPNCGAVMDGEPEDTPAGPYDLLYEEGGPDA